MKTFNEFINESKVVLYRGHNGDASVSNDKIIWLTPNRKHAESYGSIVSEVKVSLSGKKLKIPEMNRSGTILDLLQYAPSPKTDKQKNLYDDVVYHFGGGKQIMDLPKFLHKIGSEKVIKFLKSVNIKIILAIENGIITYGIIK
jgi:hypothetical protein